MQVNRTENKIIVNRREMDRLIARLSQIMPLDPHCADGRGYSIRTLYFDTVTDRCCAEKEDGLLVHEKLRLRIYGNSEEIIKLECKHKTGDAQVKKTMFLSRSQYDCLLAGDYGWLLTCGDPLGPFFYHKLSRGFFPKAVVEYRRLAFMLPVNNTRITFDYDIRATEASFQLFGEQLLTHPILPMELAVLEVKFNNFLPDYIKNALRDLHKSTGSFSKYFSGRSFYRSMV